MSGVIFLHTCIYFAQTEAALYHDAVKLFATAFAELYATDPIKPIKIKCNDEVLKVWEHGNA
jgi:ionotropic glutamate receptor